MVKVRKDSQAWVHRSNWQWVMPPVVMLALGELQVSLKREAVEMVLQV